MATLYEYHLAGDSGSFGFSNATAGGYWIAQTFTPQISHSIISVKLKLGRSGTPGTITISIRATSGGLPSGSNLTSGTTDGDTLTTDLNTGEWREITLTPYVLTAGVKYAIIMRTASPTPTDYAGARGGGTGYANGIECYDNVNDGATWNLGQEDLLFEEWGNLVIIYPTNAITRVTNLIHRFDRRKGIYLLEMALGEVTSDFGMPTPERYIPGPTIISKPPVTTPPVIAPAPTTAPAVVPRPSIAPTAPLPRTGLAEFLLGEGVAGPTMKGITPYEAEALKRMEEPAAPTPRTVEILRTQVQEVQKAEERVAKVAMATPIVVPFGRDVPQGPGVPTTEYTRHIVRESPETQQRIAEALKEQKKWWEFWR